VIGQVMRPGVFTPGDTGYTSQGHDRNTQQSFTQEVRLQYGDTNTRLKVVTGVFYQRAKQNAIEVIPESQTSYDGLIQAIYQTTGAAKFGALATSSNYGFSGGTTFNFINDVHAIDTQLAGFADVTYRLTDKLTASAGLRYADIKFDFQSLSAGPYAGNSAYSGKQQEKAWTPSSTSHTKQIRVTCSTPT
jgi:outer membrane receptor protein involved in Fe transport